MNRILYLAVAAIFLGMAFGIAAAFARHGFHVLSIPIVAIVLGSLNSIVKSWNKASSSGEPDQTNERLTELDRRVTDLQDIVISIDDKLQNMSETRTTRSDA